MAPPTTFDLVSQVLIAQCPDVDRARLHPEATLSELDIDSLSLMEFVFAIEDRFDVRLPEDELDPRRPDLSMRRVCEVLDAAVDLRNAEAAGAMPPALLS